MEPNRFLAKAAQISKAIRAYSARWGDAVTEPPYGETLGRYVISTGEEHFPGQLAPTPGQPNAGPRVGPVVLNEIMYHPNAGDDEFVELKNITTNAVSLFDAAVPTNTWRLNGADFDFPTNIVIGPGELLLLVATNSGMFRATYGIPAGVQILGP